MAEQLAESHRSREQKLQEPVEEVEEWHVGGKQIMENMDEQNGHKESPEMLLGDWTQLGHTALVTQRKHTIHIYVYIYMYVYVYLYIYIYVYHTRHELIMPQTLLNLRPT